MKYKHDMTEREIARAAMALVREFATFIALASDSNKVWNLISAVYAYNARKPVKERI